MLLNITPESFIPTYRLFSAKQELTVDRFIPNDTYIADGSRVALITGANCSGKSVYVKQVVHIVHTGKQRE